MKEKRNARRVAKEGRTVRRKRFSFSFFLFLFFERGEGKFWELGDVLRGEAARLRKLICCQEQMETPGQREQDKRREQKRIRARERERECLKAEKVKL